MQRWTSYAACAVAFAAASPAVAQNDVEMVTTDLGGGVHMIVGRGGNIGVSAGDDGVFMIDDQFAPLTPLIEQAVRDLAAGDVRFIVNTHYHGDHTGGNEEWNGRGAAIFAHDNVRTRLAETQVSTISGEERAPLAPTYWPSVTFAEGLTFHMNGQTVRVIHVADAHTDGDAIIYFEEANVLHMGDAYFNGMFPYIDVNAGGGIDGYIAAQDAALALIDDETRVIPGHGPLASRADLEANRIMLAAARERIATLRNSGAGLEETVAANPLTEFSELGGGFISTANFIAFIYNSLGTDNVSEEP